MTKRFNFPPNIVVAAWEWRTLNEIGESYDTKYSNYFDELKSEKINTIYFNINEYIDLYEVSDSTLKEVKLNEYKNQLIEFITSASNADIKIHALAGDKTWVNDSHNYLVGIIIDFVKQYNDSVPQSGKFSGLQFDIEPYTQKDFAVNREKYLLAYINFVNSTQQRINKDFDSTQFAFSLALPFWLDNEGENSEILEWNSESKYVIYHILDLLNRYNNSYAVIMNYRNSPYGSDGLISHLRNEINYISETKSQVKVIMGVETIDIEPTKITYFGKSKNLLKEHYLLVAKEFPNNILIGISLHTVNSFTSLKDI